MELKQISDASAAQESKKSEVSLRYRYNSEDPSPVILSSLVLVYESFDPLPDFFARITSAQLTLNGLPFVTVTGKQWSAINSVANQKIYKDRNQSKYYIRFPLFGGININMWPDESCVLDITFKPYDNDGERLKCHASALPSKESVWRWSFSPMKSVTLRHKQEAVTFDFDTPTPSNHVGCSVAQFVYFLPPAHNKAVRSGEVCCDGNVISHFAHPFESSVMDKLLAEAPVPEGAHVFTCTFADWTPRCLRFTQDDVDRERNLRGCLQVHRGQKVQARLRLDGDQVPDGEELCFFTVYTNLAPRSRQT